MNTNTNHLVMFVIDTEKEKPYVVNMAYNDDSELNGNIVKLLNCDYMEYHRIHINGRDHIILCDEEGRLKSENPKFTVYQLASPLTGTLPTMMKPQYCGNVIICNEKGSELGSLTEEEIADLMDYMRLDTKENHPVLMVC